MQRLPIDLSRFNMRLLHNFKVVAQELSFSKAALRLNMSQPPLSVSIKELEATLNTVLFERTTRSVSLTQAGQALLREVELIDEQMTHSLQRVQQLGRGEMGHIRIGVVGSAVWGTLLARLKNFCCVTPKATWSLSEIAPIEQIEALRRHQIDLGIWRVANGVAPIGLECQLLESEDFWVALPEQHRFAPLTTIDLVSLADENFVFMPMQEHGLGQYLLAACRQVGFTPPLSHIVNEPQTALALVGEGYGVSLLPACYARIRWPNVVFRPLDKRLAADLYAVYNPYSLTPTVQNFLQAFGVLEFTSEPQRFRKSAVKVR